MILPVLAIAVFGGCASTVDPGLTTTGGLAGSSVTTSTTTTAGTEPASPVQNANATSGLRPVAQATPAAGATTAKTAAYTLTEEEKGLSCKKLTGRMQVRILQLRDWESQTKPSALAQTFQKTVSAFWPGDTRSSVIDERYVRDRAQLDAYNAELASKDCKTFNLDEELGAHSVSHTPEPGSTPGR